RVDVVRKVILEAQLLQVGCPLQTLSRVEHFKCIVKVARDERRIGEQPVVEQVVPAESSRSVTPAKAGVIAEGKVVTTRIQCHKKSVVIVVPPVRFGVDVEEVHQVIFVGCTKEHVGI